MAPVEGKEECCMIKRNREEGHDVINVPFEPYWLGGKGRVYGVFLKKAINMLA